MVTTDNMHRLEEELIQATACINMRYRQAMEHKKFMLAKAYAVAEGHLLAQLDLVQTALYKE